MRPAEIAVQGKEGPQMRCYVGTSGFSYPKWRGAFYPAKLKSAEFLTHYASQLTTVEVNNTFYRMPRRALFQSWLQRTAPEFRFAIKASRRVTHFKKLRDTGELLGFLALAVEVLGERLGPILFQTPPTLRADRELLLAFLDDVAASPLTAVTPAPIVMEFRHASWLTEEVFTLLAERGAALCASDGDDEGRVPTPLLPTAPVSYVRLRKDYYSDAELHAWSKKILELGVDQAFVYFKHEDTGPALALRLASLLRDQP